MRLNRLHVKGFRSLKDVEIIFTDLTVLIGENDAGKSSILDLLEILLGNKPLEENDFYCSLNGTPETKIEIEAEFILGENDDQARKFSINDRLRIKKIFTSERKLVESKYWGAKIADDTLNIDFTALDADKQKEFIQRSQHDITDQEISNAKKRVEWFTNYLKNAPKTEDWIDSQSVIEKLLPRFERYSAMDYKTPSAIVAKTLKQVYEQTIFETAQENGLESRRLVKELRDVEEKARKQISTKVDDLEKYIKRYNKRITGFGYQPNFNFLDSLKDGEFLVNSGRGLHPLSRIGDGSKRRMYMAVMDWDKDVNIIQAKADANLPSIIRGYDEPDTNLHYGAQRLMYQSIEEIVTSENSRVQAILCTHSLAMIDRAPTQNIRMLTMNEQGCTEIEKLETQDDPEIENFLLGLARELGITNSMIFYERCFVLIEGETEENALPILYKKFYNRSMVEDGIRLINIRGNSAANEFLRILSSNRQKFTLVFIDADSKDHRAAKLSKDTLKDARFAEDFIKNHVFYVGNKEFEDAFPDDVIVKCLNLRWRKNEGDWNEVEIRNLRESKKFSDAIKQAVHENSHYGDKWDKPYFGKALAENCNIEQIPQVIKDLFIQAQEIANGHNN